MMTGALVLLVLASQAGAAEWTVGTERIGTLRASSYSYYGLRGLHVRCDVTHQWNVGVTGAWDRDIYEGSYARDNDDLMEIEEWKNTETTAWILASVGRRIAATQRLRCDALITGGYDQQTLDNNLSNPRVKSDSQSWSLALAFRPEVRVYRNLWLTGQFGVRWITTDSKEDRLWHDGSRRTLEENDKSDARTYGGFRDYQLGVLWTF